MVDEETQLGKYTLKHKLATGGMAEIWLSEQRGPGGFAKELVIKRILPHLADDEKFVEMFLDEARLAAQLHHPNIVQIFDLGEADGSYYIAMEYIRGYDLEQLMLQAKRTGAFVDPHIASRIIADACGALDYAHTFTDAGGNRINLVHRDISPQNILIDVQGVVKLVDFGVAKAASSTHKTQTGAVKGKFAYMSPEQIKGKQLDGRSDLFAMGIVLFEMLADVRPFGHDNEMLAVAAILDQAAPKPSSVQKGIPKGLDSIVIKALEKAPDNRFVSAEAMQLSLETFLKSSGQPLGTKDLKSYIVDTFGEQLSTRPIPTSTSLQQQGGANGVDAGAPPPPPGNLYRRDTKRWKSDPKFAATERVDTSSSKGGVGAGLIIALVAVFLAILGGGYGLYSYLTSEKGGDPVVTTDAGATDDAGAVISEDVGSSQADATVSVTPDTAPDDSPDAPVTVEADAGPVVVAEDVGVAVLADAVIADGVVALTPDVGPPVSTDAGVTVTDQTLDPAALVQLVDVAQPDTPLLQVPDAESTDLGDDQAIAQLVPDGGFVPVEPILPDVGIDLPSGPEPDAEPLPVTDTGIAQQVIPPTDDAGVSPPEDAGSVVAVEDAPGLEDAVAVEDATLALADAAVVEADVPAAPETDAETDQTQVVVTADVEEDVAEEDETQVAVSADVEEDAAEEDETQVAASAEDVREERRRRRDRARDDGPGRLQIRISSRGRYEILIDDRVVGRVPPALPRQTLAPGTYTVEVRRIGESDGVTRTVEIESGESETLRISVD